MTVNYSKYLLFVKQNIVIGKNVRTLHTSREFDLNALISCNSVFLFLEIYLRK